MIIIHDEDFSIEKICKSGQCFRIDPVNVKEYRIIANHKVLYAMQEEDNVALRCDKEDFENIWKDYFDLNNSYETYINAIDKSDGYLQEAVSYGRGIRILKQDLWEMIITFIISQQNNIKRIKKCIETLSENYGKKIHTDDGEVIFDFPTPLELLSATEEELREMKLGYRSPYIVETTKMIAGTGLLGEIKEMSYPEAKEALLKLKGVGIKVAECICLFGLHQLEAFPIDTHIISVLKGEYNDRFPYHLYRGFEGVVQQYIFYYDLHNK